MGNGGHQASNAEHRGEAVGSQKNQRMMEGVITHQKGGCLIGGEEKREVDQNTQEQFPESARGTGNYSCRTYLRGSSVQGIGANWGRVGVGGRRISQTGTLHCLARTGAV